MDIEPYKGIDFSNYELAEFCKKEKIDALLFSTAWDDHYDN